MQDHPRRSEGRLGGRHGAKERTRARRTDAGGQRRGDSDKRGDQTLIEACHRHRDAKDKPRDVGEDRPESKGDIHFIEVLKRKEREKGKAKEKSLPLKENRPIRCTGFRRPVDEKSGATEQRSRHSKFVFFPNTNFQDRFLEDLDPRLQDRSYFAPHILNLVSKRRPPCFEEGGMTHMNRSPSRLSFA